jgi:hypothetical protein
MPPEENIGAERCFHARNPVFDERRNAIAGGARAVAERHADGGHRSSIQRQYDPIGFTRPYGWREQVQASGTLVLRGAANVLDRFASDSLIMQDGFSEVSNLNYNVNLDIPLHMGALRG